MMIIIAMNGRIFKMGEGGCAGAFGCKGAAMGAWVAGPDGAGCSGTSVAGVESLEGHGDFFFFWIAILGNQVAGKARELVVIHILYRSLAPDDRFARARKVIPRIVT